MCLTVEWKKVCEVLDGYNAQQLFTSQNRRLQSFISTTVRTAILAHCLLPPKEISFMAEVSAVTLTHLKQRGNMTRVV
jgi:hypothetical protein